MTPQPTPGFRRPVPEPGLAVALPPALCAPASHYAAAWRGGVSGQRWDVPFDKRAKQAHRMAIAHTHGLLRLTVPIEHPASHRCLWSDIRISAHGSWWDVHRTALESAYGRTPYFEFCIDRFMPMLTEGVTERYPRLEQLCRAWDTAIRRFTGMEAAADMAGATITEVADITTPYRQLREPQLGFIWGLSVLDLLFNLGPDAQLWLDAAARGAARL